MNAVAQNAQAQGVFKGVAIVIDDGYNNPDDGINGILEGIERNGGYAARLTKLPDAQADLENMANAAFFIMDWNLLELPSGVKAPESLMRNQIQENIAFLRRLKEHRHAPVFIFTHEEVAVVKEELVNAGLLEVDGIETHIMVHTKNGVGPDVYEVLNDWIDRAPSAKLLKTWEQSHLRAVNALFADFQTSNRFWPLIFWQGYQEDNVGPAYELGQLVTRLVAGRMHPLQIDLAPFLVEAAQEQRAHPERYKQALTQVIEGERMVQAIRLEQESFSTGDFFKRTENDVDKYYLNVRAECDCVVRGRPRDAQLYLIRGREVTDLVGIVNRQAGGLLEKDVEAVVFGMFEGKTFRFSFRDFSIERWTSMAPFRVGRLLPPFISRVQQRFAAFSQRAGQPRIPSSLLPPLPEENVEGVAVADGHDGVH